MKNISTLTPMQYRVTQEGATEPPFDNLYWNCKKAGIYVDLITRKPLFSSLEKYDSGCGWPSFFNVIESGVVKEVDDFSYGMRRIEVRSESSNAHLGHVFNDGPPEQGGIRYCINSASIEFIPQEEMMEKGYGEFLKIFNLKNNFNKE